MRTIVSEHTADISAHESGPVRCSSELGARLCHCLSGHLTSEGALCLPLCASNQGLTVTVNIRQYRDGESHERHPQQEARLGIHGDGLSLPVSEEFAVVQIHPLQTWRF